MDNKINQIRKQISVLRAEMLETERVMRGQVARDQQCGEAANLLIAQRAELVRLIGERKALGDLMPIGLPDLRKPRAAMRQAITTAPKQVCSKASSSETALFPDRLQFIVLVLRLAGRWGAFLVRGLFLTLPIENDAVSVLIFFRHDNLRCMRATLKSALVICEVNLAA